MGKKRRRGVDADALGILDDELPELAATFVDGTQVAQEPQAERSRYENEDMEPDEAIYLPPHLDLEAMTKEQLAQVSVRHLGRWPSESATKDQQIQTLRAGLRAGLPPFVRG